MGMGPRINANGTIQASEYFLQALEAQRSINSHIHEIEPSTPVFLYEIDLNEIKPAMVSYPNKEGPVKDGVIRVHNDFNLFNINRGIISWRGNLYFPFPIYGEQFDITSNGTIPTPRIKFSSQFLDDEFNSFYKYIRMQINELKDIVGSKVTRRKTFVRYLSPNNFPAGVNPFNTFTDTPWASRDGDALTVRSLERCPIDFAKWLVYTRKTTATTNKIFTLLRTDDRLKTLNIDLQKNNYHLNSLDFFNLLVNAQVNNSSDIIDSFSSDNFIIPSSAGYTRLIQNDSKEFRKLGTDNKIKVLCYYDSKAFTNNTSSTVNYPVTFSESSSELATFLSFRSIEEAKGQSFNYSISSQTTSSFTTSFSKSLTGSFDINYLTIPTGIYTGTNSATNENAKLAVLRLNYNFGSATSGELDISFSTQFSNMPKLLFNSWGSSGFAYDQYLKNISSTGCTFVASHTGDNVQLGTQNINLIATDYATDDLNTTGDAQMYNSYHNMGRLYLDQVDENKIEIYEVELTPDIYYIDRKTQEDSQNVVYELASLLDVEGIKLPGRLLLSKNCPFSYRGAGCLYEKSDRLTVIHSGVYGYVDQIVTSSNSGVAVKTNISSSQKSIGLQSAPPVADESNNTFYLARTSGIWIDKALWKQGTAYKFGNYIYIEKNQIKFYFVCKMDHTSDSINSPPNTLYWSADSCSKSLEGCRLRWKENMNFGKINLSLNDTYGTNGSKYDPLVKMEIQAPKDGNGNQLIGILPFGGFPSVEGKFQSQQSPGAA